MAMEQGGAALGAAETVAPQTTGKIIRHDCGWLACDRMPMEVRRTMQSVEVGDIVEFVTYEASSKEDTPPFLRMLGHRVLSLEPQDDGGLVISVERAR